MAEQPDEPVLAGYGPGPVNPEAEAASQGRQLRAPLLDELIKRAINDDVLSKLGGHGSAGYVIRGGVNPRVQVGVGSA